MASNREITLKAVEAVVLREPIQTPVRTSFGVMRDRPAVFIRVTDADRTRGYGEVWCNFPTVAAEHRKRLVDEVAAPLLMAEGGLPAGSVYDWLMERLHVLAIQSGEWGPLRQVAAGLDAAVHDLAARRARLPLFRYLNPSASGEINAYASGIGPEDPARVAAAAMEAGHVAFKLKVGFGRQTDIASLEAIRSAIGDATLMIDANQGWDLEAAVGSINAYADHRLLWVEEPLRADRPIGEWRELARSISVPIAAGENCGSRAEFDAMMTAGVLGYLQPDVAKWGGVSGCMAVARAAADNGVVYCPHFLGGGIGLLASAHLLAAQAGTGMLEIDTNPNGLRDRLAGDLLRPRDGAIRLTDGPGIGIEPDELFE